MSDARINADLREFLTAYDASKKEVIDFLQKKKPYIDSETGSLILLYLMSNIAGSLNNIAGGPRCMTAAVLWE